MNNSKFQANCAGLRPLIWIILSVAVVFAPIIYRFIFQLSSDYSTHNSAIIEMLQSGDLLLPHFLYHAVAALFWQFLSPVLNLSTPDLATQINTASLLTELLFYELLALILYYQLISARKAGPAAAVESEPSEALASQTSSVWRPVVMTVLSLMLVGPVLLLWPIDRSKYLGYIATNAFHNPTMPVLKPFAVLLFAYVCVAFAEYSDNCRQASLQGNQVGWRTWMLMAAVTLLSVLAKPSYIICLLPAVLVYAAYRYLLRRHVNFALLSWGIIVPTGLMLGWQYWFTYTSDNVGVIFAPLAAMSSNSLRLLPKFVFSILFPLAVYFVFFHQARKDMRLNLAWLVFGFAAFYSYFLAEAGRVRHGNFIWSGQIALLVLFVQSMVFLVRETAILEETSSLRSLLAGDRRLLWCLAIYGAHFASGVYYYIYLLTVSSTTPRPYG